MNLYVNGLSNQSWMI